MKKKILAALMIMGAILVPGIKSHAAYGIPNAVYPDTMIVVDFCYSTDEVILEDCTGNLWSFYGIDDWEINDVASVLMNDKGTDEIYDDEIIMANYCSYSIK